MLVNLVPYFEKNILSKKEPRLNLIKLNKAIIRDYLNTKIEMVGFEAALDSEYVKNLWGDLIRSMNESGTVNHRFISNCYYFKGLSKDSLDKMGCSYVFNIEEFNYLAYGLTNKSSKDVVKDCMLSKSGNFLKIPVPPMVILSMDGVESIEASLLNNFVFDVPKGMDITTYYEKNLGIIDKLKSSKIKEGLEKYLETAKDPVYDMSMLMSNYTTMSDSEMYSIEWNEMGVSNIIKEYSKIVLEHGIEKMLSLQSTLFNNGSTSSDLDALSHHLSSPLSTNIFKELYEEIKDDICHDNEGLCWSYEELYERFIVDINKMECSLQDDYSNFEEDHCIEILLRALKNGKIENIYIANSVNTYILKTWSHKTRKSLLKYSDSILLNKKTEKEAWLKLIRDSIAEDLSGFKFDDLEAVSSPQVFISLHAIFDKLFDWFDLSDDNDSSEIKKEKQLKLLLLLNENKAEWFNLVQKEVRINRELKKVESLDSITELGLEKLIEISEEFKK